MLRRQNCHIWRDRFDMNSEVDMIASQHSVSPNEEKKRIVRREYISTHGRSPRDLCTPLRGGILYTMKPR